MVHFQDNIRNIVFGSTQGDVGLAIWIAIIALGLVAAMYIWASWYSLGHKRRMQHALGAIVDSVRYFLPELWEEIRKSSPDHPPAYYEVISMELAQHPQTILAYEMNGKPLPINHGAPLRLRVETVSGYKMVKYLRSIEFVAEYSTINEGQGGFREDYQFYGRGAEM